MPAIKPAPRRVLVVDDVVDNIGVLFEFLRDAGFRVLVSESARHAIAELPRMAPDIILLDVMMPEMDGLEACRRIKSLPEFADVPILFMTALSDPVDKVRGLQAGAADYITKPLFPKRCSPGSTSILSCASATGSWRTRMSAWTPPSSSKWPPSAPSAIPSTGRCSWPMAPDAWHSWRNRR